MRCIKWIHFSDLHVYVNDPSMADFQEDIKKYVRNLKPDFIVVTGDYRNIRAREGYRKAKKFIYELMNVCKLDLAKDLFLVPGNHDTRVQKKKACKKTDRRWKLFEKKASNEDDDPRTHELEKLLPQGLETWDRTNGHTDDWLKKHENDPQNYIDRLCGVQRHDARDEKIVDFKPLLNGFAKYCDMAMQMVPWYGGNGVSPAMAHHRKWETSGGIGFNLVHLNTAVAADGSYNHYQAIDLVAAKSVLYDIRNGLPTIVLAHNSFYDLHPDIRRQLVRPLSCANTYAWLCGDAHQFSTEKTIPRPPGDQRETIRIFVCGKSAPDHSDTFSENGFIEYVYDGEAIYAHPYEWPLVQTRKRPSIAIPVKKGGGTKGDGASKSKCLMIGYLSCNPMVEFQEKYHLGQAYFIHKIDQELMEQNHVLIMTTQTLRDHNRSKKTYEEDVAYSARMIEMWNKCFDGKVAVLDIKKYFEKPANHLGEPERQLLEFVNRMEGVMDTDDRCKRIVDCWSKHEQNAGIDTSDFDYLKNSFEEPHGSSVIQGELLSFAYLLYKRPMWYTSDWLIRFIDFWNKSVYHLIREELKIPVPADGFYIIESKRNHYVWDAIIYCAKRFAYVNFPKVKYFDMVMDKGCRQPMKSSNREKAVFLAGCGQGEEYTDTFITHIQKMFDTDLNPDAIAKEYYSRLFRT